MATPASLLIKALTKAGFPTMVRPQDVVGRLNVVKNFLGHAKAQLTVLPSQKNALQALRNLNFGVSASSFSKVYKDVVSTPAKDLIKTQYGWGERIPVSAIPQADWDMSTKYVYQFKGNVLDHTTGKWSEQWFSLGTDRKITANQAWQEFQDNFIDSQIGNIGSYYSNYMDFETVSFESIFQRGK